jgi:PPOX class probable F420-dependent enzyme
VSEGLRSFGGHKFLNLESYRRSGRAVRTPVWFVESDGRLYVRTAEDAGKVKRIRGNWRVRVAACDYRGRLRGEWVEGAGRIVEGEEAERANRLLKRKYGLLRRLIDLGIWLRGLGHVVIAVES